MSELPGDVLAAISTEMVRLKATLYGKGPLEAKTYQCDDMIFTVMRNPMTRAERLLSDRGKKDRVRDFRLAFQDAARSDFCGAVERISGYKVLTYNSQLLFDPDIVVEMFVLGEAA